MSTHLQSHLSDKVCSSVCFGGLNRLSASRNRDRGVSKEKHLVLKINQIIQFIGNVGCSVYKVKDCIPPEQGLTAGGGHRGQPCDHQWGRWRRSRGGSSWMPLFYLLHSHLKWEYTGPSALSAWPGKRCLIRHSWWKSSTKEKASVTFNIAEKHKH